MKQKTISIQGYEGSFHAMAATKYFDGKDEVNLLPAHTFEVLASQLANGKSDSAIMAIENSIAGSILQNYRLLRENKFCIEGEIYLQIEHCLLANVETKPEEITQILSHPMALSQCLDYLHTHFPNARLIEADDTALCAIELAKSPQINTACIASKQAGEINNLQMIKQGIQTSKNNYTRFFIINKDSKGFDPNTVNKASIYIKVPDVKGQLLKVLQIINDHDINMSKLQSFPVLGRFREYFFHIDLEFNSYDQYSTLKEDLIPVTSDFTELGVYERADYDIIKTDELFNLNTATL
jgi:prephenate dehydratase